jgi:hypothetical protein
MEDHFGTELVESRRARERAAVAMENGPLVAIEVLASPAESAPAVEGPTDENPAAPSITVEDSAVRALPPESSFPSVQIAVPAHSAAPTPRWTPAFVAKVIAGGAAIAGLAATLGYFLGRC